jgi:hypothetical protein
MNERVSELLAAFADQHLSDAEAAELLQLVKSDPQAASALAEDFEDHHALQTAFEPLSAEETEKHQQCVLFYLQASGDKTNFFKRVEARIGVSPVVAQSTAVKLKPRMWLKWLGGMLAASIAAVVMLYLAPHSGKPEGMQAANNSNANTWSASIKDVIGTVKVARDGKKSAITSGFAVLANDEFETDAGGALTVIYNDGTELRLNALTQVALPVPGSAIQSKIVKLNRGSLLAKVSKQPAGAPLLINTPHAVVRVLGTEFKLTVNDGSSQLDLKTGQVRITQTDSNQVVELHAGQTVHVVPGQSAAVEALSPETFVVDDFESGNLTRWMLDKTPSMESFIDRSLVAGKSGRYGMHVTYHAVGNDWVWTVNERFLDNPQDWSAYAGMQFWFKGCKSGNKIMCEFFDNRKPGGERYDLEHFRCKFVDDSDGWRQIRLNFSDFAREEIANTPNDGFDRKEAHGIGFVVMNATGTFDVDDITLFSDVKISTEQN